MSTLSKKANEKNRDFCSFLSKYQSYIAKNHTDSLESFLENEPDFKNHKYSLLIFRLNFVQELLDVLHVGKNMGSLKISSHFTGLVPNAWGKNSTLESVEKTKNERQLEKISLVNLNNKTFSFKVTYSLLLVSSLEITYLTFNLNESFK